MASIDLRKGPKEPVIDKIVFGSQPREAKIAQSINSTPGKLFVTINAGEDGYNDRNNASKRISVSKDDVDLLIEALQMAKELGWI